MTYSVRNIVIALALAIAAAAGVLVYTSSYKDQVTRDQERVEVMVATQEIPAGTPGEKAAGMMAIKEVVRDDVTPGVLTSAGGLEGKVTSQTIAPGQQVLTSVFQAPTTQAASLSLDKTERGVRVNVDFASGALGAVKAGDRVDLFGTFSVKAAGVQDPVYVSRRLMTNVRILEAPVPDPESGPGKLSEQDQDAKEQTLMLAVSQEDATKLAWIEGINKAADNSAILWVAVRPPDSQAADMDVTLENIQTMLSGGDMKPAELREKYGTYIDGIVKSEIAIDALRNEAAAGTAPTDTTATADADATTTEQTP